ncbi:hypothetical protein, partial [Frankia sp. EI5c]
TVAMAEGQKTIPQNIVGMTEQEARNTLTGLGLQVTSMQLYDAAE